MNRNLLFPLLLAISCALGCSPETDAPAEPAAKKTIKLGVLPAADAAAVHKAYGPLVKELSKALGRPVELVVPATYEELITKLKSSELQLAQLSAAAFVQARGVIAGQVLVQQSMDFATEYRGAFIVKKGAFKGLKGLKGKRFAYVDQRSSAGYWFPRMKLRHNDFDPDKVFGEVLFAGSHAKVVQMVRDGKADGGVVSEQTVAGAEDVEILETTVPIPDDVIVAIGGLTQQEQESLRALLLGAADNAALAAYLRNRKIRAFKAHDYDQYALLEMELRLSGALLGAKGK